MDSEVNYLNQLVTKLFTKAMKDISNVDHKSENYEEELKKYLQKYRFSQKARDYFNDLNNIIILGGNKNSSKKIITVSKTILKKLNFNEKIKDELFQGINNDEQNNWNESFGYIIELQNFQDNITEIFNVDKNEQEEIKFNIYQKYRDAFILKLEQQEDSDVKLLKLMDNEIGNQKYDIDTQAIKNRSIKESENIVEEIITNNSGETTNKKELEDNIQKFKEKEIKLLAQTKIIEKKYDKASIENKKYNLDGAIESAAAHLKKYPKWMDRIAIAGIFGILILMFFSITCPIGCSTSEFEINGNWKFLENPFFIKISEVASSVTILENKTLFGPNNELTKIELTTTTNPSEIRNPYREILESNIMYVLISTVIAPIVAKTLKQKYDINIEEKQISMIISDGIKATSMYTNEADKLRNSDGKIPRKYQEALRAKAFKSIKTNYEPDKYKELISSVGSQIFDKAIENAVETKKINSFPLEKKQVKEIIKQAIDATPKIIKWKDLSSDAKASFINGNIRSLLQNTGAEGWAYDALESEFDAEISNRIIAVQLAVKHGIIENLDGDETYLQYTSEFVDMVYATI